ncbi:MAG: hypothetical protein HYV07_31200 [Deltaproteobacteria bacterium]|nr:hypothetical protein [Deltaproteobacteria bacterium]
MSRRYTTGRAADAPSDGAGDVASRWRQALATLHTWRRGDQRAPHKPLLLLMLLARAETGGDGHVRFAELEPKLRELLRDFGPPRKSHHPEYPFWHLQGDGLWVVADAGAYPLKQGGSSPTRTALLTRDAEGFVPAELWRALQKDATLRRDVAATLLDGFWPSTYHASIRKAVGLPDELHGLDTIVGARRKRDPDFREAVLRAYERRCAVCGYDGQLGGVPLGLEAAHIQWHACDGPDEIANGLALCSFHHVALDTGALGLTDDRRVRISSDVHGQTLVPELLHRHAGAPLRAPQPGVPLPAEVHIAWHGREVFRAPARPAT